MVFRNRQRLFPEEERMKLSRYYHEYPLHDIDSELKSLFSDSKVLQKDAIPAKLFTKWLLPAGEYLPVENGCCMLQDGTGYVTTCMKIPPEVTPGMITWFLNWVGTKPRGSVRGHGNLRYKIWNPADHFDHHFVNWTDESEGVFSIETMDMGSGDRQSLTVRKPFSPEPFGMTDDIKRIIRESGCLTEQCTAWESLDEPNTHVVLSQIRPTEDGGYERRSARWVGVRPYGTELVRVHQEACGLEYLKKIAYHGLVEWQHLMTFLPELYKEYSSKGQDED